MPEPLLLEGNHVRLEPLSEAHIPCLVEAAAEDRSQYRWTYTPDGLEQMTDYVRDAIAKTALGAHVAFATVRKAAGPDEDDRVVGATRFCEIFCWQWPPGASHQREGVPDVVDIGFTWLAGSAQRTPVNTEAKLVMLDARLRGVAGPPRGAADRRAQRALVGGHRTDRGPTRRHHAR